jgi:hypothetical protein
LEQILSNSAFRQWVIQALTVFFLVWGLVGIAVGVSLIVNSDRTLRLLGTLNRWVSMRSASRPLEIPRDTTQAVQRHRYWLGAVFIAGGAFATFILATKFDAKAATHMLNLTALRPVVALLIVDSARWILIAGNLVVVAAGILLAFFPAALAALEAGGSAWFSERRALRGADTPNLSLDNWVSAHPRGAGVIITVAALLMASNVGIMLLGMR